MTLRAGNGPLEGGHGTGFRRIVPYPPNLDPVVPATHAGGNGSGLAAGSSAAELELLRSRGQGLAMLREASRGLALNAPQEGSHLTRREEDVNAAPRLVAHQLAQQFAHLTGNRNELRPQRQPPAPSLLGSHNLEGFAPHSQAVHLPPATDGMMGRPHMGQGVAHSNLAFTTLFSNQIAALNQLLEQHAAHTAPAHLLPLRPTSVSAQQQYIQQQLQASALQQQQALVRQTMENHKFMAQVSYLTEQARALLPQTTQAPAPRMHVSPPPSPLLQPPPAPPPAPRPAVTRDVLHPLPPSPHIATATDREEAFPPPRTDSSTQVKLAEEVEALLAMGDLKRLQQAKEQAGDSERSQSISGVEATLTLDGNQSEDSEDEQAISSSSKGTSGKATFSGFPPSEMQAGAEAHVVPRKARRKKKISFFPRGHDPDAIIPRGQRKKKEVQRFGALPDSETYFCGKAGLKPTASPLEKAREAKAAKAASRAATQAAKAAKREAHKAARAAAAKLAEEEAEKVREGKRQAKCVQEANSSKRPRLELSPRALESKEQSQLAQEGNEQVLCAQEETEQVPPPQEEQAPLVQEDKQAPRIPEEAPSVDTRLEPVAEPSVEPAHANGHLPEGQIDPDVLERREKRRRSYECDTSLGDILFLALLGCHFHKPDSLQASANFYSPATVLLACIEMKKWMIKAKINTDDLPVVELDYLIEPENEAALDVIHAALSDDDRCGYKHRASGSGFYVLEAKHESAIAALTKKQGVFRMWKAFRMDFLDQGNGPSLILPKPKTRDPAKSKAVFEKVQEISFEPYPPSKAKKVGKRKNVEMDCRSAKSDLVDVALKDIINQRVLGEHFTNDEKKILMQFLPNIDRASFLDAKCPLFESSAFQSAIAEYQRFMRQGLLEVSNDKWIPYRILRRLPFRLRKDHVVSIALIGDIKCGDSISDRLLGLSTADSTLSP